MKHFLSLSLLVFLQFAAFATTRQQDDTTTGAFSIVSKQEVSGGGSVLFFHDKRIEKMVSENSISKNSNTATSGSTTQIAHGFRVQVYSSNRQRVAKDEAFRLESRLNEAFPGVGVYVSYTSPFWKVRIGDFRSMEEARNFTDELLRKFPALKGDTYTVRERIR
jgi:hypothetical protein